MLEALFFLNFICSSPEQVVSHLRGEESTCVQTSGDPYESSYLFEEAVFTIEEGTDVITVASLTHPVTGERVYSAGRLYLS